MNITPLLMKAMGRLKSAPEFEKQTKQVAQAQEELLLHLVNKNANTRFGKNHKFDTIHSVADFQKQVPIQQYADLLPYIDRMKKGEHNELTNEDPEIFALTSGSTGEPKYIPLPKSFISSYSSAVAVWMYYLLSDHPTIFNGKIFSPMPTPTDEKTEGGIPLGTISGYIQAHLPSFVLSNYVLHEDLLDGVKNYEDMYYIWCRLGVEADVTLMMMANPATHILFAKKANQHRKQLIKDIRDGTLWEKLDIPEKTRGRIEERLAPNPERAAELARIVKKTGKLYPKDFWPNHGLSVMWKSGSMGTFVPQLPGYYGDVPVREAGYSATEGRFATPVQDEGSHGVLSLSTCFYEFIPEAEMGSRNPTVLTANQVKIGENYIILITNPAGLYRYNINDVVRVNGFYNKAPLIEFLHKGQGFSSMTGEKLSEWQVLKAVQEASLELDMPIQMYLAKGEAVEPQRYLFYIGFSRKQPKKKEGAFIELVDEKMQSMNIEYKKRRGTGRLGTPALINVDGDAVLVAYHQLKLSQGFSDAQMKFPVLITDYNSKDYDRLIEQGVLPTA